MESSLKSPHTLMNDSIWLYADMIELVQYMNRSLLTVKLLCFEMISYDSILLPPWIINYTSASTSKCSIRKLSLGQDPVLNGY